MVYKKIIIIDIIQLITVIITIITVVISNTLGPTSQIIVR